MPGPSKHQLRAAELVFTTHHTAYELKVAKCNGHVSLGGTCEKFLSYARMACGQNFQDFPLEVGRRVTVCSRLDQVYGSSDGWQSFNKWRGCFTTADYDEAERMRARDQPFGQGSLQRIELQEPVQLEPVQSQQEAWRQLAQAGVQAAAASATLVSEDPTEEVFDGDDDKMSRAAQGWWK